MGWGLNQYALVRIPVKEGCKGYYLRWYYSGWHYWYFLPGTHTITTEGEKYRTIGTRRIILGSGQITRGQATAIRNLMNTREVHLLTIAGWANIRIEPGSLNVYDNQLNGEEMEFTAIIGSKEVSYNTGYSPSNTIPKVPPVDQCEVIIGNQVWMCRDAYWDFPGSKVYNNDENNRAIWGGLYTFDQIKSPGFCPDGWKVPTVDDFNELVNFLGTTANAGGFLKESLVAHWNAPNVGADNSSRFTALGGGFYINSFLGLFSVNNLWTSNEQSATRAYLAQLRSDSAGIVTPDLPKNYYLSVRLLKKTIAPPILKDIDLNEYHSIIIGSQEWLIENLKVTHYLDSVPISNLMDNFYLPSKDEFAAMHDELFVYGVGGFTATYYWTSSEQAGGYAWAIDLSIGAGFAVGKSENHKVRACRSFAGNPGDYALRDIGPTGGLIFAYDNGFYFEAAPSDCANSIWSNITIEIGATAQNTAIGTGQWNTNAIIGQFGHSNSAALLCTLVKGYLWILDTAGAYCWYNDDITNKNPFGALYNWPVINNARGLVYFTRGGVFDPGWRVSSLSDWQTLFTNLGGSGIAGGKLKEVGLLNWTSPNMNATDEKGFKAVGGGRRHQLGSFSLLRSLAFFWTSTPLNPTRSYYSYLAFNSASGFIVDSLINAGYSIRCVRDV